MDYVAVANFNNLDLIRDFPNLGNLIPIVGDDTHYFINEYPENDNLDIRKQYSNFANIPILKDQLEFVFDDILEIDAFVLNPLNRNDFPVETIDYLKTFNVPIYLSMQGFLRIPDEKIDDKNYSIKLEKPDNLDDILNGITAIFLDESEAKLVFDDNNYGRYDIDDRGWESSYDLSYVDRRITKFYCGRYEDDNICCFDIKCICNISKP